MGSKCKRMELMHGMCEREIEQLQMKLSEFLTDSLAIQAIIAERLEGEAGGDNTENMFSLLEFDNYMTQITGVLNLARKFNIHLQLNSLKKCAVRDPKSLIDMKPSQMLTEYVCNSILREQSLLEINTNAIEVPSHSSIGELVDNESPSSDGKVLSPRSDCKDIPNKITSDNHEQSNYSYLNIMYRDLSHYVEGYEFIGSITYVKDLKERIFYLCESNEDMEKLIKLSNTELQPISTNLPTDKIFGINMMKSLKNFVIYRGVKVDSNGILLIDFGEIVSLHQKCTFFSLPSEFENIPAQAVKCILLGVNRIAENDDEIDSARKLLNRSEFQEVRCRIVRKLTDIVEVLFIKENDSKSISKKGLMQAARAYKNPFLTLNQNYKYEESNMPNDISTTDIVKNTHTKDLRERKSNTSKESVVIESNLNIFVTHIISSISFYGQIDEGAFPKKPIFWKDNDVPLNERYFESPRIKDVVLAQYFKDGFWYRAEISEEMCEKKLYKVFYLDYGNTETVPLSCLAKYPTDFNEPYRAVRFRLADLCDTTLDDLNRRHQAVETMSAFLQDQHITVQVTDVSEKELVVRITDKEFCTIPDALFRLGYAKPA